MTTKLAAPTVLKKIFDRKLAEVAERKQLRAACGAGTTGGQRGPGAGLSPSTL